MMYAADDIEPSKGDVLPIVPNKVQLVSLKICPAGSFVALRTIACALSIYRVANQAESGVAVDVQMLRMLVSSLRSSFELLVCVNPKMIM
jgi:hypothetical protein